MSDRVFFDTNIFVYSFDISSIRKQKVAIKLIEHSLGLRNGIISFQVLQEFSNVATKKFKKKFSAEQLRKYFEQVLKPLCLIRWSPELYINSLTFHEKYKLSTYDSLIVAAAQQSACNIIYSEDLQSGQRFNDLEVVNPFV